MKILLFIFLLLFSEPVTAQSQQPSSHFEPGNYTIIALDTSKHWSWKLDNALPSETSEGDLDRADSILYVCISENNNGGQPHSLGVHIGNCEVLKQVVPTLNEKGEKVIWVNCVHRGSVEHAIDPNQKSRKKKKQPWDVIPDWKNEIIVVNDGGYCFWNVMINLTSLTYSALTVNGI
jgi:hypothetical protein